MIFQSAVQDPNKAIPRLSYKKKNCSTFSLSLPLTHSFDVELLNRSSVLFSLLLPPSTCSAPSGSSCFITTNDLSTARQAGQVGGWCKSTSNQVPLCKAPHCVRPVERGSERERLLTLLLHEGLSETAFKLWPPAGVWFVREVARAKPSSLSLFLSLSGAAAAAARRYI